MNAIEIRDLKKVYRTSRGPLEALKGLDMEVRQGEIYGFIGVNGAGKSTTIKSLLGLLRPTSGTATVMGAPAGSMEARTKLGYLPEVANYHEFLSAEELLRIHARLARVPKAQREQRCSEALEAVGLDKRRKSRLSEFSKGMKQRFGIAQALVGDPPLLVLDELTSGLDPFAQIELKQIMLKLKARGITIFFSSHQMSEVENLCDRAGIIHRGKLRMEGTLDELLQQAGQDEIEFTASTRPTLEFPVEDLPQANKYRVRVVSERTNECVDALRAAGADLVSLRPARAELEEVFHNLVVAIDKEEAGLSAVFELARLQILENIRRQLHLITLFMAFILLVLPAYVNAFSMGVQGFERVSKDFGLTLIDYYGVALALLLASTVVPRDLERRTIYPLLSRPVPRLAYLTGQFMGVAILLTVSLLVLGLCLTIAIGTLSGSLDWRIFVAVYGIILETCVLSAACLLFSTKASPALAGVMGTFMYVVGGLSNNFIRFFIQEDRGSQFMATVAQTLKACFPSFEVFRLKSPVVHDLPIPAGYEPAILVYAFGWILLFLLLANWFFERRDL